ncbi:MAG TPA: helix-turn-helix domain-containing protein [Aurantimonas coralicida]|uniref:Helix-turn-helix domain-containing protein n=1 Tax=Aurantimonas coralicida TaxID=182270 RepID=A0A9C9TGD3_9HYPH|nr:helix-turn-helix domain-containing protein [Aurantimonas coralicida]HET99625.1 helix-turn-helix domain-containing protein [Aurantimonas coralicida]
MAEPSRHYTVKSLAAHWAVDEETIRRMIKKRRIAHLKIESSTRIPVAAVKAYEKANLCPAAPDPSRNSGSSASPDADTGTSFGPSAADRRKYRRARKTGPRPAPGCLDGSGNVTPFPAQRPAP